MKAYYDYSVRKIPRAGSHVCGFSQSKGKAAKRSANSFPGHPQGPICSSKPASVLSVEEYCLLPSMGPSSASLGKTCPPRCAWDDRLLNNEYPSSFFRDTALHLFDVDNMSCWKFYFLHSVCTGWPRRGMLGSVWTWGKHFERWLTQTRGIWFSLSSSCYFLPRARLWWPELQQSSLDYHEFQEESQHWE